MRVLLLIKRHDESATLIKRHDKSTTLIKDMTRVLH